MRSLPEQKVRFAEPPGYRPEPSEMVETKTQGFTPNIRVGRHNRWVHTHQTHKWTTFVQIKNLVQIRVYHRLVFTPELKIIRLDLVQPKTQAD